MMQRSRRRGQGLVEFALVAPVFFLLVFGIIEGGRLLWTVHTLNNAAKEGSRYAMVRSANTELASGPATDANVKAHILSKSAGLDSAKLDVDLDPDDTASMVNKAEFTVSLTYDYTFIVGAFLGVEDMTLDASSTAIFSR